MSNGVFFSKTLSSDDDAIMFLNRAPPRNRSSTIGGTSTRSRPDSSYSNKGLAKQAVKGRESNQALVNRIRSNSSTNDTGSRHGQSSRLATLGDHFKGRRSSILLAASDVLGLKLGHHKSSRQQPPKPIILPDIIDISAARADAELEERNRLRDMAAQAIGLQPYTDSQDSCYDCIITDEGGNDQDIPPFDSADVGAAPQSGILSPNAHGRFSRGSNSSLSVAYPQSTPTSRVRSGSTIAPTGATTTSFAPIPPYPSTVSSLSSFRQCEGLYPKYYPHSSLRIFALSKNWKYRYLMMSSPATFVARGQSPAVSYLHVFKSAGSEEKELERLEINEGSVVFVAEDEVGGKRSVIKVGGTDVGAMKKEYIINEGGYSMWLLQIQETADAQRWITNIKNAVLGQRTVRAGLIPAYPLGVHEPHGDMDVMLSIRTQGITTSTKPVTSTANVSVTENSSFSSRSVHSLKTPAKPPASPAGLSALKGLFIARPRSDSRPASVDTERDHEKESVPALSNNPSNILRSSTPESPSAIAVQTISAAQTDIAYFLPAEHYLDQKTLIAPHSSPWKSSALTNGGTTAHKTDVILPLQPPPRKRWTASGLSNLNTNARSHTFGQSGRPNSLQMSMDKSALEPPSPPQIGTPVHRSRASSLRSVSTFASGDRRISLERSSTSTKRSSTRRWSKQSLLPSPMSPPSDPPPPVPVYQANITTFSKRTSGESSRSTNSSGTYSNRVRSFVPPPRPPPTSALPPAPFDLGQDELHQDVLRPLETISNAPKSPFRASSVHRSSRLSLMAPKPPPNTSLPPRPDDSEYKTSRRRSSSESKYPTTLESIPGSPLPAPHDAHLPPLPSPPPVDPLPSTNRVASLKQRFRMLSTSSVSGAVPALGRLRLPTDRSSTDLSSSPLQPTTFSPPSTPIAEKIIPVQDDSFLQLYTPIMPTPPCIPGQSSPRGQHDSETIITSLSPPPRRGPKQMLDCVCPKFLPPEEQLTIDEKQHLLASPPLSPRSQHSRLLPEVSAKERMLAEDSSDTEPKLTSFLESEHDASSSRPSSIISLGPMRI